MKAIVPTRLLASRFTVEKRHLAEARFIRAELAGSSGPAAGRSQGCTGIFTSVLRAATLA